MGYFKSKVGTKLKLNKSVIRNLQKETNLIVNMAKNHGGRLSFHITSRASIDPLCFTLNSKIAPMWDAFNLRRCGMHSISSRVPRGSGNNLEHNAWLHLLHNYREPFILDKLCFRWLVEFREGMQSQNEQGSRFSGLPITRTAPRGRSTTLPIVLATTTLLPH